LHLNSVPETTEAQLHKAEDQCHCLKTAGDAEATAAVFELNADDRGKAKATIVMREGMAQEEGHWLRMMARGQYCPVECVLCYDLDMRHTTWHSVLTENHVRGNIRGDITLPPAEFAFNFENHGQLNSAGLKP
jgi:hypothetical protein